VGGHTNCAQIDYMVDDGARDMRSVLLAVEFERNVRPIALIRYRDPNGQVEEWLLD
jgi:hypothetical protein